MGKIRKILIVCTGNSCRSPMAEGFLKKYLRPEGDLEIVSAGTLGVSGFSPTQEAVEVMKEEGIDISSHSSKPFSDDLAKSADIILAMAGFHRQYILDRLVEVKDKLYLFKEFAGIADEDKDVVDPIGRPLDVYRKVKEDIKKASIEIARRVIRETQD